MNEAARALSAHVLATHDRLHRADRIECADGFTVSVQASVWHYSTPKNNTGPWTRFECGFPSAPVPEWQAYKSSGEESSRDEDSVFGWVPAEVIMAVVKAHGGMVTASITV